MHHGNYLLNVLKCLILSPETIKIPARIKPDEQRSLFVACVCDDL